MALKVGMADGASGSPLRCVSNEVCHGWRRWGLAQCIIVIEVLHGRLCAHICETVAHADGPARQGHASSTSGNADTDGRMHFARDDARIDASSLSADLLCNGQDQLRSGLVRPAETRPDHGTIFDVLRIKVLPLIFSSQDFKPCLPIAKVFE